MKKTQIIDRYQEMDKKHSRYSMITKRSAYFWNTIFSNAKTNTIKYWELLRSEIKNMVLAPKKIACQRNDAKDISVVCERFLESNKIYESFSPSTTGPTKAMFRNVSQILSHIFCVPVYLLDENHFLCDIALQAFVYCINASPNYKTIRPMAKRFYSYLFYAKVGEAYKYDPLYIKIFNTIGNVRKSNNKRTEKKINSSQVNDHPLLIEYAEYRRIRTKKKEVNEVYTVRKFLRWYCGINNISEKDMARIDLSRVCSNDIQQYVDYLMYFTKLNEKDERYIKVETASLNITQIKRFFKYLTLRGYIKNNPMDSVETIKTTRKRNYRYATQEQCKDFLETIHRVSKDPITDMTMFLLAIYLALRPSEIVYLKTGNFDLENGRITFKRAKSERMDIIELPSFLVIWLLNYMKTHPDPENPEAPMFLNHRNRPMTYLSYKRRYHRYRENMKKPIPKEMKGPHVFRHTLASVLLENNTSLEMVAKILGHTSIYHTDAYLHSTQLGVKKAVENYVDILTKGEEKSNGDQT